MYLDAEVCKKYQFTDGRLSANAGIGLQFAESGRIASTIPAFSISIRGASVRLIAFRPELDKSELARAAVAELTRARPENQADGWITRLADGLKQLEAQ